jgi:hypothetical protein
MSIVKGALSDRQPRPQIRRHVFSARVVHHDDDDIIMCIAPSIPVLTIKAHIAGDMQKQRLIYLYSL